MFRKVERAIRRKSLEQDSDAPSNGSSENTSNASVEPRASTVAACTSPRWEMFIPCNAECLACPPQHHTSYVQLTALTQLGNRQRGLTHSFPASPTVAHEGTQIKSGADEFNLHRRNPWKAYPECVVRAPSYTWFWRRVRVTLIWHAFSLCTPQERDQCTRLNGVATWQAKTIGNLYRARYRPPVSC
jgi:hypothetical protein